MAQYRTILTLLSPADRRRGDMLLALGGVALLAGEEQEAERIYQTAHHWLLAQTDDQGAVLGAARAAHGLGRALWRQEKRKLARAALECALASLGDDRCAERVKILLDLSQLLLISLGQQEQGLTYVQQARAMAHSLGETGLEMMARRIIAGNLSRPGSDLSSAMQELSELLTRAQASGDLAEVGECCLRLVMGYYWIAEIGRAHEVNRQRMALLGPCQPPFQERIALMWLVLLLASQGKWMEAERVIEQVQSLVKHCTSPILLAFLRQCQGFLAYQRDDYVLAHRELEASLDGQALHDGLGDMIVSPGLLGLVQAMMGEHEEAEASIVRLEALLASLPEGIVPMTPMRMCLALTALALGDYKRARRLYTPLLAFRGQHYWFLVDRVLGLLAILCDEWETAAMHLAAAGATAEREGLHPELARTLLGQADVEVGQGGQGSTLRAKSLLNRALVLLEELRMTASAHRVRRQLRSLAHHLPGPTRPSLPANLTQREAAVLKLVAEGRSTRQIAQTLGLSEKTVTNHLTHIFQKTGSENRTAATTFAIRYGLA